MRATASVERLGSEKIWKLLLDLSTQTTFSLMVYAIYSITDTYFLSVGINSLAAAGASIISPVLIALGGVSTVVGVGGASVVSRALGQQNVERASRTIANTFLIFWSAASLISIFGTIWITPIVNLLGATPAIAPYAVTYGRIIFLGAITSTGFSAIIRADGNARYSTAIWVIPVLTNIFLCWLFIMVLGFGAAGAASATVIGQAVSALMGIYFFFFRKQRTYAIHPHYFKPDLSIIREVLGIGLPSFLKSISASMVVIIINNLLRVIGGDSALSVFAIVSKLYSSLNLPQTGITHGMQPIVGYNFGRQQFERVKKTIKLSLGAAVVYGSLIALICWLVPATLVKMLSTDATVLKDGPWALRWMALAYPFAGVGILAAAFFQSVGKAREALALTIGGILLVKLPVLFFASHFFGLTGIWASEATSELILCAFGLYLLRRYQQQLRAQELPSTL